MKNPRRAFLLHSSVGLAFGPAFWNRAFAAPAVPGASRYGALGAADSNGIRLPPGFTSRVVAQSGSRVSGTSYTASYTWHNAPDGGACFAQSDGGWVYTSNSERSSSTGGGASMVRFDSGGRITSARRICTGSSNCAGGATPWGTWLSCEEHSTGEVIECYLDGRAAVRRPAMGRFRHEAAAVDPVNGRVYLTQDEPTGAFYRFTPATWNPNGGDTLASGTLSKASISWDSGGLAGNVSWVSASSAATPFDGGEGCWYDSGVIYFATKGDNTVWAYTPATERIEVIYAVDLHPGSPLQGVDNLVVSRAGEIFVAEDGGNMQICFITPERVVAPFLEITGQSGSEITGPAFSPRGDRLYFSSQRAISSSRGRTYEVRGPFLGAV